MFTLLALFTLRPEGRNEESFEGIVPSFFLSRPTGEVSIRKLPATAR
jgi:hypothetical protein